MQKSAAFLANFWWTWEAHLPQTHFSHSCNKFSQQGALSQFLVNSEAKVVGNEAVRVVTRGQVDVSLVLASLDDVRMDVKVSEEGQHYEHVVSEQVLAPERKLTLNVDAVYCV